MYFIVGEKFAFLIRESIKWKFVNLLLSWGEPFSFFSDTTAAPRALWRRLPREAAPVLSEWVRQVGTHFETWEGESWRHTALQLPLPAAAALGSVGDMTGWGQGREKTWCLSCEAGRSTWAWAPRGGTEVTPGAAQEPLRAHSTAPQACVFSWGLGHAATCVCAC